MKTAQHAPAQLLPIGTVVKVNCYHGRVTEVTTHVDTIDPVTKAVVQVPLAHPLYHVLINTRKMYPRVEEARYIWLRKGRNHVRLFPDEFEVVHKPLFMDTQEVIRRFAVQPSHPNFTQLARSA